MTTKDNDTVEFEAFCKDMGINFTGCFEKDENGIYIENGVREKRLFWDAGKASSQPDIAMRPPLSADEIKSMLGKPFGYLDRFDVFYRFNVKGFKMTPLFSLDSISQN